MTAKTEPTVRGDNTTTPRNLIFSPSPSPSRTCSILSSLHSILMCLPLCSSDSCWWHFVHVCMLTLGTESQFKNKDKVSPSKLGCNAHVKKEEVRDNGEVLQNKMLWYGGRVNITTLKAARRDPPYTVSAAISKRPQAINDRLLNVLRRWYISRGAMNTKSSN